MAYKTKIVCDRNNCSNTKDTAHGVLPDGWGITVHLKHLCKNCNDKLATMELEHARKLEDFFSEK